MLNLIVILILKIIQYHLIIIRNFLEITIFERNWIAEI